MPIGNPSEGETSSSVQRQLCLRGLGAAIETQVALHTLAGAQGGSTPTPDDGACRDTVNPTGKIGPVANWPLDPKSCWGRHDKQRDDCGPTCDVGKGRPGEYDSSSSVARVARGPQQLRSWLTKLLAIDNCHCIQHCQLTGNYSEFGFLFRAHPSYMYCTASMPDEVDLVVGKQAL